MENDYYPEWRIIEGINDTTELERVSQRQNFGQGKKKGEDGRCTKSKEKPSWPRCSSKETIVVLSELPGLTDLSWLLRTSYLPDLFELLRFAQRASFCCSSLAGRRARSAPPPPPSFSWLIPLTRRTSLFFLPFLFRAAQIDIR